jgi:hypothetical protein
MHSHALSSLTVAALLAVAATASGHAGHGKTPDDKAHGHKHDDDHSHEPTQAQIDKRLARVIKRAEARKKQRSQRQRDRKRALNKRLGRRLGGAPLTADVEKELETHARRVAKLRQIRYLAAVAKDYATVEAVDKLVAHENSRHERWWRTASQKRGAAAPDGKAKGGTP